MSPGPEVCWTDVEIFVYGTELRIICLNNEQDADSILFGVR
jgi:hypothetical protein